MMLRLARTSLIGNFFKRIVWHRNALRLARTSLIGNLRTGLVSRRAGVAVGAHLSDW